jgi:hypothetical protein
MRTRAAAFALAATLSVLALPPATAWAGPAMAVVAVEEEWDPAAADRLFVRWVSADDPRLAVRSAARNALLSSAAAITQFLNVGWDAAITRAAQTHSRNLDFTTRMVNTHSAQFYPRVNAAGRRALAGTHAQLEEFVRTGYAKALERDRQDLADDTDQAGQVLQGDRDFVTRLSIDDPGVQVRAWAGRAVTAGTTDADVAEFLRYGWVSASGLDMQLFRTRIADEDRRWRVQSRLLVTEAQAAEKAARETAGEAQEQLRAAAARAWGAVRAQASPARVAWADAEQVALRQAETWLLVSHAAATATSTNWSTIAGTAQSTRAGWLSEQANATAQASSWAALYQQALTAETAMTTPID